MLGYRVAGVILRTW